MGIYIFFSVLSVFMLLFSILFIVVVKKWSIKELKKIDKKKNEIEELLASADQMIDEMNKFSDYMLENMAVKAKEAEAMLQDIDLKINSRKRIIDERITNQKSIQSKNRETEEQTEKLGNNTIIPFTNVISAAVPSKLQAYTKTSKPMPNPVDALFGSNNMKTRQIIALAENGLSETEIAKQLNVGRGEIQLILGMRNGTTS